MCDIYVIHKIISYSTCSYDSVKIVHIRIFFCFFSLLVIRGVPSLIIAQSQVSAPLNSRPVIVYRKGGATPVRSPAWSSG